MTCKKELGFNGIFGVAFLGAGAQVWVQVNSSADPRQVICAFDYGVGEPGPPGGVCNGFNPASFTNDTYSAPAVWSALGEATTKKFGMYVYADGTNWTNLLSKDGTHYGQATAYIGSAAVENSHYKASSPMTVPATQFDQKVNESISSGFWAMPMHALLVKGSGGTDEFIAGQNISSCGSSGCYIDSGTPELIMPQIVWEAANRSLAADEHATVEVVLKQGGDPNQTVLSFPVRDLLELYNKGMVLTGESQGGPPPVLCLGFVTWLYYYVVFDYGSHGAHVPGVQEDTTVTFVKKP